ncbi:uncharacterized protein MONOS_4793 [Monocercomonoides exilis]|uniref:uncharacterized protein n=1 Tax=Monocercomonoides exilis TaxID=2049356 RepID=UPI0035597752|nr:hypothetical protein MONOS_4793 [Monocercomonoides exilis]|eukprot:MONOS_4793.1-p1 / transcript=MONOS_4793.1 / gene=MONOS_4793 / organism=Monocercomonoides_exilis_PA203 / gene_product=unspecified product / transcript_product=unspecified product / location=Mono_scaffold00132:94850-95608(-) / protein_length=253 / sequence_SO=supercontig / SO=protein_coding / is_pseudo=false
MDKELFLDEIKENIKYHQEHHNLTQLTYQSTMKFLIDRFFKDISLEDVIVNELHFIREASRKLDELTRCVDWKRKGDKREGKWEEEHALLRWLLTLEHFLSVCFVPNEEYVGLIGSIMSVFQASKDKNKEISFWCLNSIEHAASKRTMKVDDLLTSGVVDISLEEIQQPTINDEMEFVFWGVFESISSRLKGKGGDGMEEAKRKVTKMEMFEKLEEEGYEDIVISFLEVFKFLDENNFNGLPFDISDYFVNS